MHSIKNQDELNTLSINELILLYFISLGESQNPHIKFDGANPYKAKKSYMKKHSAQAGEILNILRNKGISTNYFHLKLKQFKIRFFKNS